MVKILQRKLYLSFIFSKMVDVMDSELKLVAAGCIGVNGLKANEVIL